MLSDHPQNFRHLERLLIEKWPSICKALFYWPAKQKGQRFSVSRDICTRTTHSLTTITMSSEQGCGHRDGGSEKLISECEEFFNLCPPPGELAATVQRAREFVSGHYASQRPIALVTVTIKIGVNFLWQMFMMFVDSVLSSVWRYYSPFGEEHCPLPWQLQLRITRVFLGWVS